MIDKVKNTFTSLFRKITPHNGVNLPNSYYSISSTPDSRGKKMKLSMKKPFKILGVLVVLFLVLSVITGILGYIFVAKPLIALADEAKVLKSKASVIKDGVASKDLIKIEEGIRVTKEELAIFKISYEKQRETLSKIPQAKPYLEDGERLINVAESSIDLGDLVIDIVKPYSEDIGFSNGNGIVPNIPAKDRIVKLINLMPEFAPRVSEISDQVQKIDNELASIDASKYPKSLPGFVSNFGLDPKLNIRGEILSAQSVTHELAQKAPQMEAMFNSMPEFMGVNETKKYLVIMANNYELRMSGGFNTYIVVVQIEKGIPTITYSIDTYFIDEGARTGSSILVNRNVPRFLRNYLYLSGNTFRLYARDATSTNADFPLAADRLVNEFWMKDYTLPRDINGVISVNNDLVVDMLRAVGPVKTDSFSILTDQKSYKNIPVTEFNADNVIEELEDIAGNKLAETIGRKEIIKFLGDSMLEKIINSEATNLLNITDVMLQSLSRKDVMLYSFDQNVQTAFEDLGYSGRIKMLPSETWDYLHVNRSNFGAGKADWSKPGFITQTVKKDIAVVNGKTVGTVAVTVHNPKRPDWYNIDPCCFYNAYLRVYVPFGSKLISAEASDGQDTNIAEFTDEEVNKTYFETFTRQLKETDLTITYKYELPATVDLNDYHLLIQRQSGSSVDDYSIGLNGVSKDILLNADKEVTF